MPQKLQKVFSDIHRQRFYIISMIEVNTQSRIEDDVLVDKACVLQVKAPGLDEILSEICSLQSKHVLLLGVVGRFSCQRVL